MSKTVTYPTREESAKRASRVREVYNAHEVKIIQGDSRRALAKVPDKTFQCCITSPPYWGLRDYGIDGQIGAEFDPSAVHQGSGRDLPRGPAHADR